MNPQLLLYSSLALVLAYIIIPSIIKVVLRKKFLMQMSMAKHIYLTFDDGPDSHLTYHILEILKIYNARATFFLLGENIDRYPDIVRTIINQGHEVGNHSYGHHHAFKSGPIRSFQEIFKWDRVVEKHKIDVQYRFYRPPFGKLNLVTLLCILFSGKKIAFWDADPKDFRIDFQNYFENTVLPVIKSGSVILLHDGRVNGSRNYSCTVDALYKILNVASSLNIGFATLSEAIGKTNQQGNIRIKNMDMHHNGNTANTTQVHREIE